MSLRVVADHPEGLRLDPPALRALADAVRFQLDAWRAKTEADLDEDAFADLQNDIQYLEILLERLVAEQQRISPFKPG